MCGCALRPKTRIQCPHASPCPFFACLSQPANQPASQPRAAAAAASAAAQLETRNVDCIHTSPSISRLVASLLPLPSPFPVSEFRLLWRMDNGTVVLQLLAAIALLLVESVSSQMVVVGNLENAVHTRRDVGAEAANLPANLTVEVDSHSRFVAPARRKLGLFRECAPCKCCTDSTRRYCYYTACCYRIDCFAPGLSFGHCSFVPVTCNCLRC